MSEEAKTSPEEITSESLAEQIEQEMASQESPSEVSVDTGIPKKFVGKSFDEVLESYSNVEKHAGKLASELDQERKAREELEARLKALETQQPQQQNSQQYAPQQAAPEQQVDPLAEFDNYWEEDPKEAIKLALQKDREARALEERRRQAEAHARTALEYYQKQRAENPDYVRREPVMQQLLQKYQGVFDPVKINSREVLEILDMASRGSDIDYYSKQAVAKAKEQKQEVVEKKRAAFSESPVSDGGDDRIDPSRLTAAQLEKLLPHHDE